MKNWLNKYNDIPSAQKGKTITVSSKDDPRYKAYQDSLQLYKGTEQTLAELNSEELKVEDVKDLGKTALKNIKSIDDNAKVAWGNTKKKSGQWWLNYEKEGQGNKGLEKLKKEKILPTQLSRQKSNVFGTDYYRPLYKKPEQPVVLGTPSVERIDSQLVPIPITVDSTISGSSQNTIATAARIPKYFDVTDNYQTATGEGQTDYRIDNPDELRELPKEGWKRKVIPQFQEGGAIKDNRGQWAHPGKITQIDSNFITMKNVPYPVLGVSDKGDSKIMYPEQDYEFIGNNVTEYPMAKNGKKLANFTNWLSKYE